MLPAREAEGDAGCDAEVARAALAVLVGAVAEDLARAGVDGCVVGLAVGLVEGAVAVAVRRDLTRSRGVARVSEDGVVAGAAVNRVEDPVAGIDRVVALVALDPLLAGAA